MDARRLAFGHRHMRLRLPRVQTQTRSDSPSTVKVIVFITSELPSICGRYLLTTLHLQPPPLQASLSPPLSGTAVGTLWHFTGDKTLHEIQPCHITNNVMWSTTEGYHSGK